MLFDARNWIHVGQKTETQKAKVMTWLNALGIIENVRASCTTGRYT